MEQKRGLRRLVSHLVVITLLPNPVTFAASDFFGSSATVTKVADVKDELSSGLGSDPEADTWIKELEVVDEQDPVEKRLHKATENAAMWYANHSSFFEKVFLLYLEASQFAGQKLIELGPEKFDELVAANDLVYPLKSKEGEPEHPLSSIGRAEFTTIDNKVVMRIVHRDSQAAILFINENEISRDSLHLKKYVDRQNVGAGTSRTDGKRGRDVIIIWTQNNEFRDVEESARPDFGTKQWLKKYRNAVVKKPEPYHWKFGLTCGAIQVAAAACVSGIAYATGVHGHFDYSPLVLNALFGTVIGVGVSTYQNWLEISYNQEVRKWKSSVISYLFAGLLMASTGEMANGIDFGSAAMWLAIAHLMSNVYANNWLKVEALEWVFVLRKAREAQGKYMLPFSLPYMNHPATPFKATDVYSQIHSYVPLNMLRLADLMHVPGAFAALWMSIPLVQYKTLKWAEKHHPQEAQDLGLRQRWENGIFGRVFNMIRSPQDALRKESLNFTSYMEQSVEEWRHLQKLWGRDQNLSKSRFRSPSRIFYDGWLEVLNSAKDMVAPLRDACHRLLAPLKSENE